jgi:hypothetical protein
VIWSSEDAGNKKGEWPLKYNTQSVDLSKPPDIKKLRIIIGRNWEQVILIFRKFTPIHDLKIKYGELRVEGTSSTW